MSAEPPRMEVADVPDPTAAALNQGAQNVQLAAGQMPLEHLSPLTHFQLAHSGEAGASLGLQP